MIRILIYPNITYSKDLSKDSFIDVVYKMISELNKIRKDLYFYILIPSYLDLLNFDNLKQIIMPLPKLPNTMRLHFDTDKILSLIPNDIDIIWSHLPEHTLQLSNLIFNKTDLRPTIIGYCHWFEFNKTTNTPKNTLNMNILGLLEMKKCYLNTQTQKTLLLKEASYVFHNDIINKLEDLLEVYYLGIQEENICKNINKNYKKIIVFNHRPEKYKDYDNFIKITDELYKNRRDFKVWVPLLDEVNRNYITNEKLSKIGYYKKLNECCVGFSPKQTYAGWSVATTDGLMNGLPYIMYNEEYYKELWKEGDLFSNKNEAYNLLNKYLDNSEYRNKKAEEALKYVKNNYSYTKTIHKFSNLIDNCITELESKLSNTSTMPSQMINLIKENGIISKEKLVKTLKWGEAIPFTYVKRRVLKECSDINNTEKYESYYTFNKKFSSINDY